METPYGDIEFEAGEDIEFRTDEKARMYIRESGKVGIGIVHPSKAFEVKGFQELSLDRDSINGLNSDLGINLKIDGTSGAYGGFSVQYLDLPDAGIGLFGRGMGTGGLNIGSPNGINFAPANASAFNVLSDRRLKKGIKSIETGDASSFMDQIRKIESATFWYKSEDKRNRVVPHIGVIAQSLPKALQVGVSETANGSTDNMRLGVSLSDWLGLVTIGVKENDQLLQQLKKENEKLKAENDLLQRKFEDLEKSVAKNRRNEQLESEVKELKSLVKALLATKENTKADNTYILPLEQKSFLSQNHPNPFHENTLVDYFIPTTVQRAYIKVTSLDGKELGKVLIQETGRGQVNIKANTYPQGTYYYSLVLDGKIFETKKMVLTK
jgi:hypothetical protein